MSGNSEGSSFSTSGAMNTIDYFHKLRHALLFWSFALALDIFLINYGLDGLIFLQWDTITSFRNIGIILLFLTIYALFMSVTIPFCNALLTWLLHKWFFNWLKEKWERATKGEDGIQQDFIFFHENYVHRLRVQNYAIEEKHSTAMDIYNDNFSKYNKPMEEYVTIMNICLSCTILAVYDWYYLDENSLLNYLYQYTGTWFGRFVVLPVFLIPLFFIVILFAYVKREKDDYASYLYSPYLAKKIRSKGKEPPS